MKSLNILLVVFLTTSLANAQTDCRPYLPTDEDSTWEITNYNAKGKVLGTSTYELVEKTVSGNDITFIVKTTSFDKKGEEQFSNSFEAKCENGKFDFNMAFKIDPNALKSYQNMDIDVDASDFEVPSMDADVGTYLDDGSLSISAGTSGASLFKMTINITDRKVEAKESMTTPAGTFDCMVISQNINTKMMLNVKASSKEWYAENVGLVRSESYNKKGKLQGYSVLTKLEL